MGKRGELNQTMRDADEEFLVEIPMLLEDLQALLRASTKYRDVAVAYDDDTLGRIEAFFLDVLDGNERVEVTRPRLGRIFMPFAGEAVRERAGGRWNINPVAGDPSFGLPVVVGAGSGEGVRFSPAERRDLFIENRQPFLRELIGFLMNQDEYFDDLFKDL